MKLLSLTLALVLSMMGASAVWAQELPVPDKGTHVGDVADHPTDGHAGHGHGHGHVGEPEITPEVFDVNDLRYDLAVYSFVVFLLLLAILTKYAWGPVIAALDTREANIRKNIQDAETARVRAEQMLAEHAQKLDAVQDEVREILAEARRDAEHTKADIVASAQKEADAIKRRALEEINRSKDQALDELFRTLTSQVTQATEHVLGRAMTEDDRTRLIDEALAELSVKN